MESPDRTYSLDELSALAGVPRRTVRYYIQLGLVDRPIGETRAAYYTWNHLRQLLEVRKLADQGLALERIGERLRGEGASTSALPPPRPGSIDVRSHVYLSDGIELVIEPGRAALTPEQLRRFAREALAALARIQQENPGEVHHDPHAGQEAAPSSHPEPNDDGT